MPALGRAMIGAASLLLAACASVPKESRLLTSTPEKKVASVTPASAPLAQKSSGHARARAVDRGALRVLSWNIHKAKDADLHRDLARHASENDLLLLQEAVLDAPMRAVLDREGLSWQMAGAFAVRGVERGVLIAARGTPVGGRELRANEPLFPIPKSAIVTHYRLPGRSQQLAVANLHGINFSLGLRRFREQLDAVADELKHHDGPMVFGGDFNTWSLRRSDALGEVTKQLGLTAVAPFPDDRRRAFGQYLDHLFVRGFSVAEAQSPAMKSSDHNPILVTLKAPEVNEQRIGVGGAH
jgi:endonuclease/exonuclease/phosphatase (EEP) superfamily protein YafD